MPWTATLLVALLSTSACTTLPAPLPAHGPRDLPARTAVDDRPAPVARAVAGTPPLRASLPRSASPVVVPLDATALSTLPRETVAATTNGQAVTCNGIPLAALLRAAGAMSASPLRDDQLDRYVQVDARDGRRALFSLAELDASLGANPVFVVDRCDGAPLTAADGPLRLLAPREPRAARSLRQVRAITVVAAP